MKRKQTSKITGFTLTETLIAMLIGSLVAFFAISSFQNLLQHFQQIKKENVFYIDLLSFYEVFSADFENSVTLKNGTDRIEFLFCDSAWVEYEFKSEYIIRLKEGETDTFSVNCKTHDEVLFDTEKESFTITLDVIRQDTLWKQIMLYKDMLGIIQNR